MADSNETIVPKTPESEAKLTALVKLTVPCITTEQQAIEIASALVDFTEQAIRDDRKQRTSVIRDCIYALRNQSGLTLTGDVADILERYVDG